MTAPTPLPTREQLEEHKVDLIIGRLLQAGVLLAAAVVLVGAVLVLARHGGEVADYRTFVVGVEGLRSLRGIVHGAFTLDARSVVQFGLVLLILTPVARVALTLVAFILERDRTYIVVTVIVLAVLLYGFLGGKA